MRVSFSIPLKPLSGKHNFAVQLAEAMARKGVKITSKKPHVNLVFVKGLRKGCKNIFRLDGVLMNTRVNYKKKNNKLKKTISDCDGIVYQNEFCKKAGDKFLGRYKPYAVISNGAQRPTKIKPFKAKRPYILAISRWRPHKRLKFIIRSFLASGLEVTYDLIVLGEPDYKRSHQGVIYKGKRNRDDVWSTIVSCEYVVHLAHIDWCPNSVVESLVCGKNVMHSSTGGTKELVKENGVRIKDKPWSFKPIDLYDPPNLDLDETIVGYKRMFELPEPVADYLNIDNIAQQYIDYCRKILDA